MKVEEWAASTVGTHKLHTGSLVLMQAWINNVMIVNECVYILVLWYGQLLQLTSTSKGKANWFKIWMDVCSLIQLVCPSIWYPFNSIHSYVKCSQLTTNFITKGLSMISFSVIYFLFYLSLMLVLCHTESFNIPAMLPLRRINAPVLFVCLYRSVWSICSSSFSRWRRSWR